MIVLFSLAIVFTQLSVLAFGGGNAILPELQYQVVTLHQWMTAEQFSAMFAMAQAAPGPNMMIVPLVGWHVAGFGGLLVTSLAKFGPSSLITIYALKFWNRFKDHPFRIKFETALKPITVSLVLVSAWVIAQASVTNIWLIAIVVVTIVFNLFKNLHPVWCMLIGACAGMILL